MIRRTLLMTLVAGFGLGNPCKADVLFVSDAGSSSIKQFDSTTGALLGTLTGANLITPNAIAFDSAGDLFVSDLGNQSILKYDQNSRTFSTFVAPHSNGLTYPFSIAFGPDGSLYVANYSAALTNATVERFSGTTGASLGTFATNPGLSRPTGLVFAGNSLFVSSSGNNAVFVYDATPGLNFGTGHAVVSNSPQTLTGPAGLAVGPDGLLYVANFGTNPGHVTKFNATTGALVGNADLTGLTIHTPTDPVFSSDGSLFTASTTDNAIFRISSAGVVTSLALGATLDRPNYMAVRATSIGGNTVTPEPASVALLGLGLIGSISLARKTRRDLAARPDAA